MKKSSGIQRAARAAAMAVVFASAGDAAAATAFFDWTSPSSGSAEGITASVAATENAGELLAGMQIADDPAFVASYGSVIPRLHYLTPSDATPGDIQSTITFSEALPEGSLLFAIDMDWNNETFTISSNIGFLTLIEQGETKTGTTSELPAYNMATGELTEQRNSSGGNDYEYSLFDVSGVSSLSIDFTGGNLSSGTFIAVALPSAVPLPASLPLLASALGIFGAVGFRKRRDCSRAPASRS